MRLDGIRRKNAVEKAVSHGTRGALDNADSLAENPHHGKTPEKLRTAT
jgi:hypothetical protein